MVIVWLDCGCHSDIDASDDFIKTLEKGQGAVCGSHGVVKIKEILNG